MNQFFYKGQDYDLSKAVEREKLAAAGPFARKCADLAANWFTGGQEFTFQTSGSTGVIKKITHTRKKVLRSAQLTIDYFMLNSSDKALLVLDPDRIAGAMMIIRSLVAGMDIIALDPTSDFTKSTPLLQACNFTAIVPLQLEKMLKHEEILDSIAGYKAILVGGAPVSSGIRQRLKGKALPVFETFAMTETVTHFAVRKLSGANNGSFEVLGNHIIRQDSHGCLLLEGDLTDNVLLPTNDIIQLIDEKHFLWVGRSDFIINSGGVKFSPEEIERKISGRIYAFGIPNRYVISSVHDDSLGEKIVLVFEGTEISDHITAELLKTIRDDLGKYESPREIRYLEKFPEVGNAKINRREIISILA